jgi:hypothetical protein
LVQIFLDLTFVVGGFVQGNPDLSAGTRRQAGRSHESRRLWGMSVEIGPIDRGLPRAPNPGILPRRLATSHGDRNMANERLLRLKTGAIDETRELFGIFIYLWVLLSLFSLHKALVLNDESLIYHQGFAIINALALAKVVLVAEFFHVGDNLKNRPLIYPIMFKSAVFAVILICFHIIEEALIGVLHGKALSQSIPDIGGGKLQGILMVGIIMFVVLMPFFAGTRPSYREGTITLPLIRRRNQGRRSSAYYAGIRDGGPP